MSEHGTLPSGWAWAALADVTQPSPAKVEPSTCSDLPYVGLEHIESGTRRLIGHGYAHEVKSTKAVFRRGDVLYGKLRPYLRKVWRAEFDGVCSTDILVYPTSDAIDSDFLAHLLASEAMTEHAVRASAGINLPRVNASALGQAEFPLPPLTEQRRIVAKLDALLASSRAARAALEGALALTERQRQAVLGAALAPSSAQSPWGEARLADLVQPGRKIAYGVLKPGEHDPAGVRLLKSGQVRDGFLDLSEDFRITAVLDAQFWRTKLQGGEVLLNLVGASIGRSAIAPTSLAGANVSRAIGVIPVVHELAEWVQLTLQGPAGRDLMRRATGGSAQGVLNLAEVRELPVPLPPARERARRIAATREALARIDALDTTIRSLLGTVATLEASLFAKAFAGTLVLQDPADEPASALLARVRAERSATPRVSRRRAPVRA